MRPKRFDHTWAQWWLLGAMWVISSGGCEGCGGCGAGEPPLATLQSVEGEGAERDFAAAPLTWSPAELGAGFALGDGLRTSAETVAVLRLFESSILTVQPETLIRFRAAQADGTQHIDVETGEAVLRAASGGLRIQTSIGMAILKDGTELRLTRDGESVIYEVELGSATFRNADGETVEVLEGQQYEIGMGEAVFRSGDEEPTVEPIEEPEPEEEPDDLAEDADNSWGKPGLETPPEMTLPAGRALIVHSPDPELTLGVDVRSVCPEAGVVQLTSPSQRFFSRGIVTFALRPGSRAYSVRCISGKQLQRRIMARGRVRLMRDSGTRRLPRKAPVTHVDADGRTYSILYQNQPPTVVVHWPRAPSAKAITVNVDGQARQVQKPSVRFSSGELRDGTHTVNFAAEGRRSRDATIRVAFDNAAPKASLTSPTDRGYAAGDSVKVSGVALPGWNVSLDHGTIEMDASHRFEGQVVTSVEHPNVVLRLTHPARGTHVYIRRPQASP